MNGEILQLPAPTVPMVVEKNIPIPGRTKPAKYPWAKMKVGDSFLIDAPFNRMVNASRSWAYRHNQKFVLRMRNKDEHGESGVRIWRVK